MSADTLGKGVYRVKFKRKIIHFHYRFIYVVKMKNGLATLRNPAKYVKFKLK